jgi:transcriptional regulator of nitric oxide reductase
MVMGTIKDVVMKSHLLILNEGFFISLILVPSPSSSTLMRNSLILFIVVGLGFWEQK